MALRGTKRQNLLQGIPADAYFTASADIDGFDINAYRKANKINLYLKPSKDKVISIFSAYTVGNFGFNAQVDMGDYGQVFKDKLNTLFGESWRSLISSAGKTFDSGNDWSGAFDAPIKPFIKGSNPLTFEVDCYLPLIQKGDGTDTFEENIERPLNDLLYVTLPTRNNIVTETIEKVNTWLRDKIDGLFADAQADGMYWEFVQNAIHDYQDHFFSGLYMLNNPIQYASTNSLILRIGPWRVDNVLINGVAVEYSPLIYNDGKTVFPSYAKARISFITKYKLTPELINVNPANTSQSLQKYIPKGSKSSGGSSKGTSGKKAQSKATPQKITINRKGVEGLR